MSGYFIWTIGCQMNKAESQRIAGYLDSAGYQAAPSLHEADLVLLNTCVVRQSAEDRVLGTLGLLEGIKRDNPGLSIVVTGCFVDANIAGLKRHFPHVDFFFKPGAYAELTTWAQQQGIVPAGLGPCGCSLLSNPSYRTEAGQAPSPWAFMPLIQGCNNFCSYCIVPYRRGREVSRPPEDIVCEANELARVGVKEITLLGQNVDSYGHDLPGHPDLAGLLRELNDIDGLLRIRFLTNHPKDMSPRLIEAIASLDKVCEHLELPAQAGDDNMLEIMRRGYTVEQYRSLVKNIRQHIPGISLSSDIIVGFPGETEQQFEHTFSLLEETRFDVVHIAAYSPRPGTIAWRKYEDTVPPEVKKSRVDRVEQLQAGIAGEINRAYQGRIVEVLVEGKKKGKWYGRARSDKLVFFADSADRFGQAVKVEIDKTSPWALQGEIQYNGSLS